MVIATTYGTIVKTWNMLIGHRGNIGCRRGQTWYIISISEHRNDKECKKSACSVNHGDDSNNVFQKSVRVLGISTLLLFSLLFIKPR